MKNHFIVLPVIFLLIVSGCITPSSISSPTPPPTPPPTMTDTYKINEPATDGNLRVTLLKLREGDRTEGNNKELYIDLKIENLMSEKTIQILKEDFLTL